MYDDSLLLLGARLVAAGKLPYRDFYSHYGPFGYAVLAPALQAIGNPGLTLRVAQGVALAAIVALLAFALRRTGTRSTFLAAAALAFSGALAQSSFLGIVLAGAALALYAGGRTRAGGESSLGFVALGAAGALLAAAAWTRPAFAAYVGAAILWLELAGGTRPSRRRLGAVLVCALVASGGLWLWLFRPLGIGTVVEATLLVPARLMTLGRRTLLPEFVSSPFPLSWLAGAAIAAAPIAWAWSIPSRRGRLVSAAAIGLGAVLPMFLGPRAAWLSVALALLSFGTAAALAVLHREDLRGSPALWAAAAFGVAAAAFGHYFWSRPDLQHLYPLLAFSAASVAFAWTRLGRLGAAAAVGSFVIALIGAGELRLPVESLVRGGIARVRENAARPGVGWKTLWPAGEVPGHAVAAVAMADRLADPNSRFVAFGSDQSWTPGDPVFLFLLSSRLPYTKWFQYDPGLQSSPAIQEEMIRELEASGSRSAVVWRSENYFYDPKPAGLEGRSPFDAHVDRIYGEVVGRFGSYEVRTRE